MNATDPAMSHAASPQYATINHWCQISAMARTATYEAIARGQLRAIKLNRRTLIDVQAGLDWMRTLPAPEIAMPLPPKRVRRCP